jgi:pre-mRNA-splicing factor CWC22
MDIDPFRRRERERQLAERAIEEQTNENALVKKSEYDPAAEFAKLVNTRSGGAYIPPSRLRAMQKDAEKDKTSAEWQRMTWDALRKSINGLINKVSYERRNTLADCVH